MSGRKVGVVLGTEDSAPLEYWFAVAPGSKVQLDDIVTVAVPDPEQPDSSIVFYGVVDHVRRRLEGVQFDGDTELVSQGLLPAHDSYAARVRTTRVEPEEFIPPGPGDPVVMASGELLDRALFHDSMQYRLPAGVLRSGNPSYINLEFLDGRKGGHVNISGISGVATKTSYALFLLYSLFNARSESGGPLLQDSVAAKAVVFNVKGRDLFWLDRPNNRYAEEEGKWQQKTGSARTRHEALGLPTGAFASVQVRAPAVDPRGQRGADVLPEPGGGADVAPYCWSLLDFARDRLLPFALVERDAMTNLGFLVDHIVERLHVASRGQKGPGLLLDDWTQEAAPARMDAIDPDDDFDADRLARSGSGQRLAETVHDLVDFLQFRLLEDNGGEGDPAWVPGRQARGTREALIRRLRGAAKHLDRLVRGDASARQLKRARPDILDSDRQVHVIDIHSLPALAQMFTVGVLLRQVFDRKEAGEAGKVFVVLDELNKYAPSEGESPIKDLMLDIAERGRSLGVILIGAQQTASEVERRVVGNAAIRVTGRLDTAEAERGEYRYMPASSRARTSILTPGTMFVYQPDVPVPLLVSFPFPSWATRESEARAPV